MIEGPGCNARPFLLWCATPPLASYTSSPGIRHGPGAGGNHAGRRSRRSGQALQSVVLLRFFIDPATGEPHVAGHNVTEEEVEDVLARPLEDRPGSEGSRVALGQTEAGRYLKVIYVPDPEPGSVFVITAYDLGPKAVKALRRRRKRK